MLHLIFSVRREQPFNIGGEGLEKLMWVEYVLDQGGESDLGSGPEGGVEFMFMHQCIHEVVV